MDADETLPRRRDDPLARLGAEDLNPLSEAELVERVALLQAEIARVERHRQRAASHRASADALFRR
jgi:uncharacterized small protein (DUF1192 family)